MVNCVSWPASDGLHEPHCKIKDFTNQPCQRQQINLILTPSMIARGILFPSRLPLLFCANLSTVCASPGRKPLLFSAKPPHDPPRRTVRPILSILRDLGAQPVSFLAPNRPGFFHRADWLVFNRRPRQNALSPQSFPTSLCVSIAVLDGVSALALYLLAVYLIFFILCFSPPRGHGFLLLLKFRPLAYGGAERRGITGRTKFAWRISLTNASHH